MLEGQFRRHFSYQWLLALSSKQTPIVLQALSPCFVNFPTKVYVQGAHHLNHHLLQQPAYHVHACPAPPLKYLSMNESHILMMPFCPRFLVKAMYPESSAEVLTLPQSLPRHIFNLFFLPTLPIIISTRSSTDVC